MKKEAINKENVSHKVTLEHIYRPNDSDTELYKKSSLIIDLSDDNDQPFFLFLKKIAMINEKYQAGELMPENYSRIIICLINLFVTSSKSRINESDKDLLIKIALNSFKKSINLILERNTSPDETGTELIDTIRFSMEYESEESEDQKFLNVFHKYMI